MLSLRNNFLFVHIPKTAGNAIQNILRHYSEDDIVCIRRHQDGVERFQIRNKKYKIHKHSKLIDYKREIGDILFDRLFKFTCVRNPWERMISYYFSPHVTHFLGGFIPWRRETFIKLVNQIESISAFLSLNNNEPPFNSVDFTIRFESLNDDFKELCNLINIRYEELPIRNKSEHEHYSKYYDDELIELVYQRFKDEIEYFGYKFEPIA